MSSEKLAKICKASCHSTSDGRYHDYTSILFRGDNRSIIQANIQKLLETKEILKDFSSRSHICLACLVYVISNDDSGQGTSKRKAVSPVAEPIPAPANKLISDVQTMPLDDNQMSLFAMAIGSRLSSYFRQEASRKVEENISERVLYHSSYKNLWEKMPIVLQQFYKGILSGQAKKRNISIEATEKRYENFVMANNTICQALNSKFVSEKAMAENLYLYFLSNSIRATDLFGRISAGGSHGTIGKVYTQLAANPTVYPKGFIFISIDNQQILGKTWKVQLNSKLKSSVVTSVVVFKRPTNPNPQNTSVNLPFYNSPTNTTKETWTKALFNFLEMSKMTVDGYRNFFIEMRLKRIKEQCQLVENAVQDPVSRAVNPYTPGLPSGFEYSTVEKGEGECSIHNQEVMLLNPNSYESIEKVLDQIILDSKKGDESRDWLVIVADGVPYSIGREIIKETRVCPVCSQSFKGKKGVDHFKTFHSDLEIPQTFEKKYSNITFRPGNGHYELNLIRALFKPFFPTIVEPIAEMMGSNSILAKERILKAKDHHQSWQLLEIITDSIADELLYGYVKECLTNDPPTEPTVVGFADRCKKSPNKMCCLGFQFAFWFAHSILLFRAAIRQCNHKVAIQAREVAAGIFYGFNHPIYQKINLNDVMERILCPEDIRPHIFLESLQRPGSEHGQGIDFLLEEENKAMKRYVLSQHGVPTSEQWQKASRAMDKLQKITSDVKNDHQFSSQWISRPNMEFPDEKFAVRQFYRDSAVFNFTETKDIHTPNSTVSLSSKFIECRDYCEHNRKLYYKLSMYDQPIDLKYLAITKDDEEKDHPEKWTNAALMQEIRKLVMYLPDDEHRVFLRRIASKNKLQLLETLQLVQVEVEKLEIGVVNDDSGEI